MDVEYIIKRFDKDELALDFVIKIFDALELESNTLLIVENVDYISDWIFDKYKLIEAAGGYVLNSNNALLMIHRLGYWDMPKGKIDKGETARIAAIREVEEECGINNLSIKSDPFITFHLYGLKGETVIKKSLWFLMDTSYTGILIPQREEGIELAEWVDLPVAKDKLNGAYSSIKEVVSHYSGN